METILRVPGDLRLVGVQRPLFREHTHAVEVRDARVVLPDRVRVKWRCLEGDELAGREFSETFDLTEHKGRERFKDFLFAMLLEMQDQDVDLHGCVGKRVEVMAVQRSAGQSSRVEIIHHLLQ